MNQKDNPPNLFTKLVNFTKDSIKHVGSGCVKSSPELKQQRISLCEDCEFFNHENRRCNKCGCPMDKKTEWFGAKCPIKKW